MVRSDLSSLPAYVPGATLPNALKLASNEGTYSPLPSVARAIEQATSNLNRYPDMGAADLRQKFADWLNSTTGTQAPAAQTDRGGSAEEAAAGLNLTMDNIAVGNGSSALCLQLIQATCAAGEEVVFAWRSFEAYPILSRIAEATPVPVPLTADQRHDLPAMVDAITDNTRLIFVCNPNNPTGTTVTAEEFHEFMAAVPDRVTVVLDEAYVEFNQAQDGPTLADVFTRYPNVAVCRTFSKAYGLAGLRLGYLIGHEELVQAVNKVAVPFGVNALAQAAGLASLDAHDELHERVEETVTQRNRVTEWLQEHASVRVYPSEANFVWLGLGDKAEALDAALKEHDIVARCFAGEGVRISVTNREETDRLLDVLQKVAAYL